MNLKAKLKKTLRLAGFRLLENRLKRTVLDPESISPHEIKNIVFVQQHDRLHQLILAIPIFRAVREKYPHAHITVIARNPRAEILIREDAVDAVIGLEADSSTLLLKSIWTSCKRLRGHVNLAIVLTTTHHSFLSDLVTVFLRAKYTLGTEHFVFKGCRNNFMYNLVAPYYGGKKNMVELGLDIVGHLKVRPTSYAQRIGLRPDETSDGIEFLLQHGIKFRDLILGIHIDNGAGVGTWPVRHYLEIARHFGVNLGAKILVFWSRGGFERCREFQIGLPFMPVECSDLPVRARASVIKCCNGFLSCDLDYMYLAASVGTPLLGLFGDLDVQQWKPVGNRYLALKGGPSHILDIDTTDVIRGLETLFEQYSKTRKIANRNFDISEQVVDDYLGFGDITENH